MAPSTAQASERASTHTQDTQRRSAIIQYTILALAHTAPSTGRLQKQPTHNPRCLYAIDTQGWRAAMPMDAMTDARWRDTHLVRRRREREEEEHGRRRPIFGRPSYGAHGPEGDLNKRAPEEPSVLLSLLFPPTNTTTTILSHVCASLSMSSVSLYWSHLSLSLWMMSPSQGQHETECSRFESKPRARRTADRVQCAIASLLSLHHADSATDSTTAPRQPPIPADIRPAGALDISSSSFASHAISSFRSIATSFPSLI